jgi:hypothetical protein
MFDSFKRGLKKHAATHVGNLLSAAASGDPDAVKRAAGSAVMAHAGEIAASVGAERAGRLAHIAGAASGGDVKGAGRALLQGLAHQATSAAAQPAGPGREGDLVGAAKRIGGPLASILSGYKSGGTDGAGMAALKALSGQVARAASGKEKPGEQQSSLRRIGRQLAKRAPQLAEAAGRGELREKALGQLSGMALANLGHLG